MDKQQARDLIKKTFEQPFDKTRFTTFVQELLNHIEHAPFNYYGSYIPEAYRQYISSLERIGKFNDGENRIDILIIKLQKDTSLASARTMQRNFIAGYLQGKYGSSNEKEAALVAYVAPDEADWRFSLVKMAYKFEQASTGKMKVEEELTPARRWSFLVGENEKSHTAQSRLVNILNNDEHNPTLTELEEAFNIESVTKEFFIKYRDLFIRTKEALDEVVQNNSNIKADFEAKGVNTVDFAKKLLGQIVFLYFLQKKGWFGVGRDDKWGTGSKKFLRELFKKKHGGYNNFFNDILEPLFYEALRIGEERKQDDYYYSRFNCKIPFLNGGLFDPIGNYDWVHTDMLLPDSLFSNFTKTKEGDTGNGIVDIFDRYNFTVREDEPLEKEVAIDPELLGKTYEKFNAIRPDNFEEYKIALKSGKKGNESKFNKQYGVYYTPREIVHYMCQQSLINYLFTELNSDRISYEKLGDHNLEMFGNKGKKGQLDITIEHKEKPLISKEDIDKFIHVGEQVSENEAIALIKEQRINTGIQKSTEKKLQLPESIHTNAELIDQKLTDITVCDPAVGSGAFPVGMMSEIVKARMFFVKTGYLEEEYTNAHDEKVKRTSYNFKRDCIEKSLYGVDIDPGAVEIAKLRLWLSLVVDEEDIKNIKPLPNLDYKIVCGNSLLGVQRSLENWKDFAGLEKLKPLYFNETNPTKKQEYKRQIDQLISQITNGHTEFDFEVYFSEVFHKKGGFDVVIANPPYISHDKIKDKDILKRQYKSYEPFADFYCYFIEKAIQLQNKRGLLNFITSNSYLRAEYGSPIRKLLRNKNNILCIINLENVQIFENAIVNVAILISTKNHVESKCFVVNASYLGAESFYSFIEKNGFDYEQGIFDSKSWSLIEPAQAKLQRIIERAGKTLEELGAKIRLGLATGYNNAFVIDENQRQEFLSLNPMNGEIIKPLLRGRDISHYSYEAPGLYILLTKNGVNVKRDYPDIYRYLDSFDNSFKKRGAKGQHWTNLRACAFFEDFKKEKIIWIELSDRGRFALCTDEIYLLNSAYFLLPPYGIRSKYLLAILNSKLIHFYLQIIAETSGMGTSRWINNYVKKFPLPKVADEKQSEIITIVDQIIFLIQSYDYRKNLVKQAKVKEYEKQIDQMVYQLYGLTENEIKIVEGIIK